MSSTDAPVTGSRTARLDLLGLVLRLVLGAVMLWASLSKITALETSALAVRAYQIFPYGLANAIGYCLPMVELVLGLLLVLGLFTRVSALVTSLFMVAFIAGITSAWARGLSIDCGCFGGGGTIDPDAATGRYITEIVRDVVLAAMGLWLVRRPRTAFALDRWVLPAQWSRVPAAELRA